MPVEIGNSFGRYHILEQLGEGGMAIVYKAYDTRLERDVAIKIIRRGAFPPDHLEQILKRFERESRALARLFHPNIVKVLDYGEHEGSPYMVLEFLAGGTLKRKLGKPIPWRESIQILLPIAGALEYAHGQGIIHRDIKPSNILLTNNGQPLLTDFGIAKILEARELTTLTGTGVGVGTPEYMAPEQWTGQADVQSDIYSLGVVLYEMVTGRKPYVADTPAAILLKQATEPLPRPTQFAPNLPIGMERLLIKALSRNPKDRFQSMRDFATGMEKLAKGQQVESQSQKIPDTSPTGSGTYATIAQEDSQATRYQETTRDTLSMSPVGVHGRTNTELTPQKNTKSSIPIWAIAGIGGLAVVVVCIVFAILVGRLGRSGQTSPSEYSSPNVLPESPQLNIDSGKSPEPELLSPTIPPDPPSLGIGSTQISSKDGMTMLYVPAGKFNMGNGNGEGDEKPVHSVTLNSFWIDQTEVTNGMYAMCVREGGCNQPRATRSSTQTSYFGNSAYTNYPVIYVSWNDAQNYCRWAGRRLPTEEEWEKAAGWDAENKTKRKYPWGSTVNCSYANYWGSSGTCVGDTTEVWSYSSGASFYGALNMAGNVWEWVSDWYDAYPGNTIADSHFGMIYRVLRGGSWNNGVSNINGVRTTYRLNYDPSKTDSDIGFRCAVDAGR
jgi:serine/threonine-protein kinase